MTGIDLLLIMRPSAYPLCSGNPANGRSRKPRRVHPGWIQSTQLIQPARNLWSELETLPRPHRNATHGCRAPDANLRPHECPLSEGRMATA